VAIEITDRDSRRSMFASTLCRRHDARPSRATVATSTGQGSSRRVRHILGPVVRRTEGGCEWARLTNSDG